MCRLHLCRRRTSIQDVLHSAAPAVIRPPLCVLFTSQFLMGDEDKDNSCNHLGLHSLERLRPRASSRPRARAVKPQRTCGSSPFWPEHVVKRGGHSSASVYVCSVEALTLCLMSPDYFHTRTHLCIVVCVNLSMSSVLIAVPVYFNIFRRDVVSRICVSGHSKVADCKSTLVTNRKLLKRVTPLFVTGRLQTVHLFVKAESLP